MREHSRKKKRLSSALYRRLTFQFALKNKKEKKEKMFSKEINREQNWPRQAVV